MKNRDSLSETPDVWIKWGTMHQAQIAVTIKQNTWQQHIGTFPFVFLLKLNKPKNIDLSLRISCFVGLDDVFSHENP
jgi:hypothetical protein